MTTVKNATPHNNKGDIFTSGDVAEFDVPRGRDEVWRFVSLRRLRGLHDGTFGSSTTPTVTFDVPSPATAEIVSATDPRLGSVGKPVDRVGAQAWTSMTEAAVITVPKNESIGVATVTITGSEATTFGAVHIDVQDGAEATIILKYTGSATHADNVEVKVGDNARLTLITDVNWNNDAVHLQNQWVGMGRDAVLRQTAAIFGGETVRLIPRVVFSQPGADAELLGVYFADDGQYFEQRLLVDHAVPNCRSNVLYKGALQGDKDTKTDTRTAWVGDVLIRAGAQGTDTYEVNRNLVLSEGARADAVPNLEIETGEIVGAGHAATVGRFDDEHLFYLMARGIPEAEARRLIVRGFFSEVISKIPVDALREELENRVAHELETVTL